MMKKKIFLLFAFFWSSILQAFIPQYDSPGKFSLDFEWVYFAPTSESSFYVLTTTLGSPFITEDRHANRLDHFYSGYRISAQIIRIKLVFFFLKPCFLF
jgi:hypothetical protein